MKNLLIIMGILILLFTGCKSDEPAKELTIEDLLYCSWCGQQEETMEDGNVQKIKFIMLFSSAKEGEVTFLSSAGVPIQNFPIYYRIEGGMFYLKGAFDGDYKVLKHSESIIELEAYLPNHSLITLTRKK
ncbi:hypothetical protein [uncultured Duncaniella sp.]|uniref:hypothetical protein n=1 Tax=uncultured Duncaniella sp. TaxID=2768039 RepID=UPI0025B66F29|nr:hypothetical protein [uncultured Duncaniella sp.]